MDQNVVHETAVLVEQSGILRLTVLQLRNRVRGDEIGQLRGFRPANLDFTHVADVEKAHGIPNRVVFVDEAGILHRHIPSAEINHLRAEGPVDLIQRCAFERGGRHSISTYCTASSDHFRRNGRTPALGPRASGNP